MEQPHNPPTHLLEPYHYISSTPGKNIRSALIDCFQLWLCVPRSTAAKASPPSDAQTANENVDILTEIKSIIASLHNASLLIDDIEDNSKLRRGNPVAHSIFGVANCINCANYVYFLALERCQGLGREEALKVCCAVVLNLCLMNFIRWRMTSYQFHIPTECHDSFQGVCTRNAQPTQRPRTRHPHSRLDHRPHRITIHIHGH